MSKEDEIFYDNLRDDDIETVLEGLSKSFAQREVTSICLKLDNKTLFKIFSTIIPEYASRANSMVARNKSQNNKIIGAIICFDFIRLFSLPKVEYDNTYEAIHLMLTDLENSFIKGNQNVGKNEILYQYATFIESDYAGKGFGTKLYEISEKNAIENNFKSIITISSGEISQYIREKKLNFTKLYQSDYGTFKYKNEFIFNSINKPKGCILYQKKLQ
jgi:GNAT superfamily N-acetyltransferase